MDRHGFVEIVINYPCATALASSGRREAQFADTARAWNFVTRQRAFRQKVNQFSFLILAEELVGLPHERRGLDDCLHRINISQWGSHGKPRMLPILSRCARSPVLASLQNACR